MAKQPLLSLCIPTWNRAKILSTSLNSFREQLASVDLSEIEIFISDNASDDDTPQVVQSFIDQGLPITYNRNPKNVGASGNFIKCMQWASGKYIWLLGDDDLLNEGAIAYILGLIRNGDYGLIHLSVLKNKDNLPETQEYTNRDEFWKDVSFWVTFMSGSVFLKEAVPLIENCERYISTHLLQVPFYLISSSLRKKNLFVRKIVMQNGQDASSNGGYNFYQVFVESYLNIWKEYAHKISISKKCYEFIKKDVFINFIIYFNCTLLLLRKNIKTEFSPKKQSRNGFKIEGAWQILFKHYGYKWYFWASIPTHIIKTFWIAITSLRQK